MGKTKVTAGLGRALARLGKKVAFLDLDYFAPNLDVELGVEEPLDGDGFGHIIPSRTKEGADFVSFGQEYVRDQAVTVSEAAAVYDINEVMKSGTIMWRDPDFLIIDTAPTSSSVIQTCLSAPDLLGTILVTQPSSVSRADLLRSLSLMKDKQVPVLGVVINQAYCICPKCGEQYPIFDLTISDIESLVFQWGVPVIGVIPHSPDLDAHFDQLAKNVIEAVPVVIPQDRKPSKLARRALNWVGKMLETATSTKK